MAIQRLFDDTGSPLPPDQLYTSLVFPEPPPLRPYVYINMVSTLDGKIVLGEPTSLATGMGSPTDYLLFRRLQLLCDVVMVSGGTLRAGPVSYPLSIPRCVVTKSGDLPLENRFFEAGTQRTFVLAPQTLPPQSQEHLARVATLLLFGQEQVDLRAALRALREAHGFRILLCEGGGKLNDALLREGLVDELFLTLTPKIKGGSHLPTVVGGQGFPPNQYLPAKLLSLYRDEDELYLRYRLASHPVSWQSKAPAAP